MKKMIPSKSLPVIACLTLWWATPNSSALPSFVGRVPNGSVFSCSTCHTAPPTLNPFGNAFLNASLTWGPALAALDSDGDGFSNGGELGDPTGSGTPTPGALVTNPGDASSHPPPAAEAPSITTPPASQTVTEGATLTFGVVATGTAPLSYQWLKDGAPIHGATDATYTINGATTANAGTYAVTVSNSAGSVTSSGAVLTVNTVPVPVAIHITSPANGATYAEPASFALSAEATPAASIAQVDFLQGSTLLGSVTGGPHTFPVLNLVAGTYTYTAVAHDLAGATTTSTAVTITVTGPPPPSGPATVTVVATDPNAAEAGADPGVFTIFRDTETDHPLSVYYQLSGTAVNGEDYQTLPTSVTIAAGATDAMVTVVPILDRDDPTELTDTVILELTAPPSGEPGYTIGSPSHAVVTITEAITPPGTNQPPVVQWLRPNDGATFRAPATIPLIVMAGDPDGTVASVEFFAGTNRLGSAQLARRDDRENEDDGESDDADDDNREDHHRRAFHTDYVFLWRQVPSGKYTLTAKVTDNQGAITTSTPVDITVQMRRRPPRVDD
jgi:hypothetical protein